MLKFFPAPYPSEWWYSVLCRYHVRSGHENHATTIRELYGTVHCNHGRLMPGSSLVEILCQLPSSYPTFEEIYFDHTLAPYLLRFYPQEKKQQVYVQIKSGKASGITTLETKGLTDDTGLKYCPRCYKEDEQAFGESYWHREHQIPLMSVCPKHGCRLMACSLPFARLSELFVPLCGVECSSPEDDQIPEWEYKLAQTLNQFLSLPYFTGSTMGYNNLVTVLFSQGYGTGKIQRGSNTLDANHIIAAVQSTFGREIANHYFHNHGQAIMYRIGKWALTSPERYAILSVLAGISPVQLFGPEIESEDTLLVKLLDYKRNGTVYKKEVLAAELGITPSKLDSLAAKYGVEPFWTQLDRANKHTEVLRITLTPAEKELCGKAAKLSGDSRLAVFARTILIHSAREILEKKEL